MVLYTPATIRDIKQQPVYERKTAGLYANEIFPVLNNAIRDSASMQDSSNSRISDCNNKSFLLLKCAIGISLFFKSCFIIQHNSTFLNYTTTWLNCKSAKATKSAGIFHIKINSGGNCRKISVLGVFHNNSFNQVGDMFAGVATFFHTVKDFAPNHKFNRVF